MLFRILLNHITGFVNITIQGFFIERFINNCINNNVLLWSVKRKDSNTLTANISIKEFKKMHNIVNKSNCKMKINSKYGLPIIIRKYRKRKLFVIVLLPMIFVIIVLSKYVWNIEIISTEDIDKNELIEQLVEEGIYIGKFKSNINTKYIIDNIRLKRDDISWMSINMKGTNVIVNVAIADKKPDIIDETINCNIISDKKAMITKITADTGTAVVKKGDIVEEKDVLIAGIMEGKYTGIRNVHAKGEVLGKVWYTKKMESRNY